MHDDSGDVVGRQSVGMSLDPHVLEAVRRVPGLEVFAVAAGGDHTVDLAERRGPAADGVGGGEVILGHVAVVIEGFTVHERHVRAVGPEVGEPQPAVDVLTEVDDLTSGIEAHDRNGSEFLHAAHGRGRRHCETGEVVIHNCNRLPGVGFDAPILELTGHEVGGADGPGRRCPLVVAHDDDVADVQFTEERDRVPVAVALLPEAGATSVPPVAQDDLPDVLTHDEEVADVVGLYVQVRSVAREPGRELDVADAMSVEERLVAPVGGRVETRRWWTCVERERAPEDVCGTLARFRLFGLVRFDPARTPVVRVEESGLEPRGPRPLALTAIGPDFDAPVHALPTRNRMTGPRHEDAVARVDRREVHGIDANAVRVLAGRAVRQQPRQPRSTLADAKYGVAEVLHPKFARHAHASPSRCNDRSVFVFIGTQRIRTCAR